MKKTQHRDIDHRDAAYIGDHHLQSHALHPAVGTRGGILMFWDLMLWDDSYVHGTNIYLSTCSISATITIKEYGTGFRLTSVYGPSTDPDKPSFLAELVALMPTDDQKWLVLGDFNLIYRASDKNNRNLNLRLMGQFKNALDSCQLSEIELQNKKFTWSNERDNPTLIKLDRAFSNAAWDLAFDNHGLHAFSSYLSDHCPIQLLNVSGPARPNSFKFENF